MAPLRTGGAIAAALSVAVVTYLLSCGRKLKGSPRGTHKTASPKKSGNGLIDAIGNTPLIRINNLYEASANFQILGETEFLNPGGSVKDRIAVKIIEEALESGQLVRGVVTEVSAGSTAIRLVTGAPAYGCKCHVVIPDDVAIEKSEILEGLGAVVDRVRPVSITHRDHYVYVARRRALEANEVASAHRKAKQTNAKEQINGFIHEGGKQSFKFSNDCKGAFFADRFENLANFRAHYEGIGPEIWEQIGDGLDAFVTAAGTGGTVAVPAAGISKFLKERNSNNRCFLIDSPGSGLFNKVTRGVMYTRAEAEGKRLKNPFDTITEGVGINRLTQNFLMAELDGAWGLSRYR